MLARVVFGTVMVAAWLTASVAPSAVARRAEKSQTAGASAPSCGVQPTGFDGWPAQRVMNRWLELIFVPKLGGRLMQVTFAGHPFLFVNPKYRGKYFAPVEGTREWFNYGGDKIWPMPEGSQDSEHWPGPISDALDDGDYAFHVVSQGRVCIVRLEGPADATTGLKYTREIGISADSPEITFGATMKNATDHAIRWSVQSVTQYDTADAKNPATFNHDFWAFTPANPKSAYLDSYHVRSGLAEDPSYSVRNNLFALQNEYSSGNAMFSLHWLDLQSEVWVDSKAGWIAVVDGASQYAMIEEFDFDAAAEYPGKATVIFYKNGPAIDVDRKGVVTVRTGEEDAPLYMEAELNSPMVKMAPGESYTFKTRWFPTRIGSTFKTETEVGVTAEPLQAKTESNQLKLTGEFGVFYPGKLVAEIVDVRGKEVAARPLQDVDPAEEVKLNQEIQVPATAEKISLRLIDADGKDLGSLGEAQIRPKPGSS